MTLSRSKFIDFFETDPRKIVPFSVLMNPDDTFSLAIIIPDRPTSLVFLGDFYGVCFRFDSCSSLRDFFHDFDSFRYHLSLIIH